MTYFDDMMAAYDRYDLLIKNHQERAAAMDTFGPGKVFSVLVADGKAFYEVVDCTETTATVSLIWPDDPADDELIDMYVDPFIGSYGTFDRERIEKMTSYDDNLAKIFSKQ